MYLSPDTTAILVADRRQARESAARRRRSLVATFRQAMPRRMPAAATERTPVEPAAESPARAA